MKSKSIRILLAVTVAIIGFSAFGCGGIPMPEEKEDYNTWVERSSVPEGVERVDVIHANFNIEFEKKGGVTEDKLLHYLNKCSKEGSCGSMAKLYANGKVLNKLLSCTCLFTNIVDVGKKFKIATSCSVPVIGGLANSKKYELKLTTVSPDKADEPHLAFSSSPKFEVIDKKFTVFTKVFVQQQ